MAPVLMRAPTARPFKQRLEKFSWKYARSASKKDYAKLTEKGFGKTILLDTETTGVGYRDKIRLIQLGRYNKSSGLEVVLIDPNHDKAKAAILRAIDHCKVIVAHSAAFDLLHLSKWLARGTLRTGPYDYALNIYRVKQVYCTMVAAQLQRSQAWSPSLASLASEQGVSNKWAERLSELPYSDDTVWRKVPLNEPTYLKYAAHDIHQLQTVWSAMELDEQFEETLKNETLKNETLVHLLYAILRDRGMRFDTSFAAEVIAEKSVTLSHAWEKLSKRGITSPNSSASIADALARAGYTDLPATAQGKSSTSKTALTKVEMSSNKKAARIATHILHTRSIAKDITSIKSLANKCAVHPGKDHYRVHPDLRVIHTTTGRSSCANPNLQQLNKHQGDKRVRAMLRAEEDEFIASIDFSNMEVRVIANLAGDKKLAKQLRKGVDIHGRLAEAVGIDRQLAKIGVFALLYGASDRSIASQTGMSIREARQLRSAWETEYPRVFTASNEWTEIAKHTGRVMLPSGWHPEVGKAGKGVAAYRAVNYMIQGTAAFIFRQAAVQLAEAELWPYIRMVVHDEFVASVPNRGIAEKIRDAAVVKGELVDYTTDMELYGLNWGIAE